MARKNLILIQYFIKQTTHRKNANPGSIEVKLHVFLIQYSSYHKLRWFQRVIMTPPRFINYPNSKDWCVPSQVHTIRVSTMAMVVPPAWLVLLGAITLLPYIVVLVICGKHHVVDTCTETIIYKGNSTHGASKDY